MTDRTRPGAGRPRGRTARTREHLEALDGHEDAFVMYFKERVYATFTGLAIVLVVSADDDHDARHAFLALLLGVLGITLAGFVSDVISHLAVHQEFPTRVDMAILLRIAGGALSTVITPAVLLLLAWLDVIGLVGALRAGTIVYIVTLGVIGWFAVRRSRLQWWKQLLVLVVLVALGLAVVALQTLAHSL
ncbi:hypothetical protein [Microbacterium terricola]|uniref:VIT family protein n=1 Tax=Microbacterium terricola TaxID=344163 RepID=A0ABM8E355_9MICO|nr:hypothetical protein [Microbacterium terricola]UYK40100.1 hypothetical protein OAU46_00170 [Microbacterium terricola]BDV32199.1 hypothetical protein Microterr_28590 [Microbacterium terricola]